MEGDAVATLEVRGVCLPEREERSLWIDGDTIRTEPVADAEVVVDGGWVLPGLVDVHTHPGTEEPTDSFDEDRLRRHLVNHRDAGVLLIRAPGAAARIPGWVDDDPELPRVRSAGRWLATPGRFFPGYGREIEERDLVTACVEEATAASGWCKIITDWQYEDPPVPLELLTAATAAVHAAGGRVAAHCQTTEGCRNAVLAGVDSLEHGMHLDPDLLDQMAAQGTALVPTLGAFGSHEEFVRSREPSARRDWWLTGWDGMPPTARAADEAGVRVLAGTDTVPFGTVAQEILWLVRAGVPVERAVAAGSWEARSWLGLPGLVDGAPADLVVFDTDPTVDPAVLAQPRRIILRGRVVR
jgi:imidazolonepropionase-like amidohydrolase